MKQFFQGVFLLSLAAGTVMVDGAFSAASADPGYHRHHHYQARYNRAYRHCAHYYRVGSHRFQHCMHRELDRYGW